MVTYRLHLAPPFRFFVISMRFQNLVLQREKGKAIPALRSPSIQTRPLERDFKKHLFKFPRLSMSSGVLNGLINVGLGLRFHAAF